ncbi:MAG: lysophospholipase [Ruminococcus sp.]|nr:lysophospholipase [Ruminococcus sp.]
MSETKTEVFEGYIRTQGRFDSSDGIHDIYYVTYRPEGEVRGVVQIAHGMCEYIDRYDDFAAFLARNGYAVCGNDHLGHGKSVNDESELGWFAEKRGWQLCVKDMHRLTELMKGDFCGLPYVMLGHSMGSFMARAYVTKYHRDIDGAVFSGTGGGIPGVPAMLTLIDTLRAVKGDKYRSDVLNSMAFGMYNSRIENQRTKYDWISRDEEIVDKYCEDPLCTYIFTLNGFENLMKVMWYVTNDKWYCSYPKNLPTYLIAGSADPVGDYGRGVLKVYNKLRLENCDIELKLYSGARHEILNETNRAEVYDDVLEFMERLI